MRILITGGAGFVGSSIALALTECGKHTILALDNLRRRGSEINIAILNRREIQFVHGDIRTRGDLEDLPGNFDLLIEASAEPSVLAGHYGSPAYVIDTNLRGTLNCLEFARRRAGALLFLSTSRVYSIESLRQICLEETADRYEIAGEQELPGISLSGISEEFPTNLPRSFYGATKLASEMLIQEYSAFCGLKALINRCGVIAGPGQFGKPDQGIFALWVIHHYFGMPLQYIGYGGSGKQVRDLLHPADLASLLLKQLEMMEDWRGNIFNVGGGRSISASLKEYTDVCRRVVGREVPLLIDARTRDVDVPLYLTDGRKVARFFDWKPRRCIEVIVAETFEWIRANEAVLKPIFFQRAG